MTIHIASCLDQTKYDVIFYIIGEDRGVIERFIPSEIPQQLIKVKSFRDFLTVKLIRVLYKENPEYVFSSSFPINARLCIACAFFPKIRVIVRSDNYLYTQSFLQKARIFFAYRFLDYLVAQTDEMRDEHVKLLFLKASKVVTYANPVDKDTINSKLEDCDSPFNTNFTNYVYVGRIVVEKGLDTLIYSFSKLLNEKPKSLLYIIGERDGYFKEYYENLLKLIGSLNLEEKIIFTGFRNNPYQYMKYADCLVLPSKSEGLPNVVIESLYLGTPVAVTTCIPVIKRLVSDGINGYTTEVDNINGFKEAMKSASELGRVKSFYSSATKEDFQKLFI